MGRLSGAAVTREAWRLTLEDAGYDGSLADRAAEIYLHERFQALRLYPDAQPALDELQASVQLVLVTNGASDTQRSAIQTTGIERYFAAIIVSGEVGVAKPDPPIFALAANRVGAAVSECWHVGDSLRTDVAGAREAGMTAIWLNRNGADAAGGAVSADAVIERLTELPRLIPV